MIVARFKVRCRPEHGAEMAAVIAEIEAPSRKLAGVVHFDVARSLTDPDTFVAIEVFEDREALDRQNAQPQVARLIDLMDSGAIVGDYEYTVWAAAPD